MSVPCDCCPLVPGCHGVGGNPAQPVYGMRCPNGTGGFVTRWYDADGNEVPPTSVAACGEQPATLPVHLTLTPTAFGDGPDSLGENLCQFSTDPDSTAGWTSQPGGCWDLNTPAVQAPLSWTTGTLTSLTFQYANPPRVSGGVWFVLNSPELGGDIVWPNTGRMYPGDVITSNPGTGGRRVRMTYLSGPNNPPSGFNSPFPFGNQIHMHRESTDGSTPPTRVRFDFLPA